MSSSGNKLIVWASVLLALWGVITAVLIATGELFGSREVTAGILVLGYAACAFTIIDAVFALKFKNDRKKTLLLNLLGIATAVLFIIFMVKSWDEVASGIAIALSLLYMGGVNRNARYLKQQEAE